MNRKMRANLNNKTAKARKERKSCPQEGKLTPMDSQGKCDTCGRDLLPVIGVVVIDDVPSRKEMH